MATKEKDCTNICMTRISIEYKPHNLDSSVPILRARQTKLRDLSPELEAILNGMILEITGTALFQSHMFVFSSYIRNTALIVLGIFRRPVFSLKHDVSETRFYLRLRIVPIQFGPIDSAVSGDRS
jgi:hypothetical protein